MITDNIRKEIRAKGYSLKDFADLIGAKQSTMSRMLTGDGNFQIKTLQKISDALGFPITYWFDDAVKNAPEGSKKAADESLIDCKHKLELLELENKQLNLRITELKQFIELLKK